MARILIAEDNAVVAQHIQVALKKRGHTLVRAESALDAWRSLGGNGFDAILINVAMPGIDGFVLAQKALTENPDTQIIFITGFAAVAMDAQRTPAYAPAPFTTRPFHLREIGYRLGALLCGQHFEAGFGKEQANDGTVIYADFSSKKTTLAGAKAQA